ILGLVWLGFRLYFAIYFDAAENDVAESAATETTETKSPEQQLTEVRDGAETLPDRSSEPSKSSTYERQQSTNAAWYLAHFQPLFDEQIEQWLEWTNRYWFSSWYAYDGSAMEMLALQESSQTFIERVRALDET